MPVPKAYAPADGVVIPSNKARALFAYLMALKQTAWQTNNTAEGSIPAPSEQLATTGVAAAQAPPAPVSGSAAGGYAPNNGKQLFSVNCSVCHQETGEGLPGAFPSLKGNVVVNDANPSAHIHAVLFGLEGVPINGVKYESAMPPFSTVLKDADIAAIINYERSSWGNYGKLVTAQDVAAERAKGK